MRYVVWGHGCGAGKCLPSARSQQRHTLFLPSPSSPSRSRRCPSALVHGSHRLLLQKTRATQGPRRPAPPQHQRAARLLPGLWGPGLADSEPGHGRSLHFLPVLAAAGPLPASPSASLCPSVCFCPSRSLLRLSLWPCGFCVCLSLSSSFSCLAGVSLSLSLSFLSDSPLTTRPSVPTTSTSPGVHLCCPPWRTSRPNGQRPSLKGEAGGCTGASDLALPLASAVCSRSLTSNLRITQPLAWRPWALPDWTWVKSKPGGNAVWGPGAARTLPHCRDFQLPWPPQAARKFLAFSALGYPNKK